MMRVPGIEAQVDMLVQSDVIAEAEREKVIRILHARHMLLNDISFEAASNEIDAARDHWIHAARAIEHAHTAHARRLDELRPLRDDPRCLKVINQLEDMVGAYGAVCHSLSPPGGAPGAEFMRLEQQITAAIRELQKLVGP